MPNLPLRGRGVDIVFAIVFSAFTITSLISDLLPTIGVNFSHPAGNVFVDSNYWYAHDADPLFMNPPDALLTGRNWIQLPAVIYATMIVSLTSIVVFGVEFFGEPRWRTPSPPSSSPSTCPTSWSRCRCSSACASQARSDGGSER